MVVENIDDGESGIENNGETYKENQGEVDPTLQSKGSRMRKPVKDKYPMLPR